ncbi:MAG TPA: D-alanyl-D-alanine carboxypeptidase/D-alanyl-D-alanine-endopeptidase [Gemmatimonadaceae bacterium]|nr:D-alanyl-D-alanine carboxypeptidase/D-alanyl-D-alanine-endopeptidase [Gemmatimonadaceae bacterium]
MPNGADALSTDLNGMLGSGPRSGRWGVMVVSLTRGDTLFAHDADMLLQPASTMKLFTAALALDRFGPAHFFTTDVLRAGPLEPDGTVAGDLVLRGGGDPALSNRFVRGPLDAPMDVLARFVAGAGVRHVRGDLIADASAFEQRRIPEGWLSRYLGASYAAPVSALSLNENTVWVVVTPGASGRPAKVALEPSSSAIPVTSLVRTTAGGGGRVSVRRLAGGALEVRGFIGRRSGPRRYEVVADDPTLFAAGAFRDALAAQGILVDGTIRFAPTPEGAEQVASLPSPPLDRLVAVMNRESVNHFAELIFRNAARTVAPVGTAAEGETLLKRFLAEKVAADTVGFVAADGSGLSVLDRASPRTLIQLLAYAHRAPWASVFHASLPVAGESELLRHRMRFTPAQGNLHAKTGTTNAVISLAGYATARNGEVVAFAFVYNGSDRWRARHAIDEMGATLAGFVRE